MSIEQFQSIDGYTFEEGVAFLRLCNAPEGVIRHIASTHNRNNLHSEIHKMMRMPGVTQRLQAKGYSFAKKIAEAPVVPRKTEVVTKAVPQNDTTKEPEKDVVDDDSEIVLTKHDVRSHTNTRYEDMPNAITQQLWLKRQDLYRELQAAHREMRKTPKGEEHNEERAQYRAEVLRLDAEIEATWKAIDAEIERFNAEKERADKKADKPAFDVPNYRSYISKALRKKQLSPAQMVELQHRVDALLAAKEEFKPETLTKLKKLGISVG